MADNKWTKPANPPPPLFLGEKERDLVKQVNDELLERVVGQAITYLPISEEFTNYHPLYGEAINKSFNSPVRVYALIEYDGLTTITENYGLDKSNSITVNFHSRRLQADQNLFVREGDYVQYGSSFYEIVTLKENRQLFGQVDHLFQIKATCIKTRKGILNLNILPTEIISAITEAASAECPESSSSTSASPTSIVRVVYSEVAASSIPAHTALNGFLGAPAFIIQEATATYLNGMRSQLSDAAGTSDFYIIDGVLYNDGDISSGNLLHVETLTLV